LNLARALSEFADVTVAFHRIADPEPPADIKVLEINPAMRARTLDDAAMRGIGYGLFAGFISRLNRLVDNDLAAFDIVLEKSWLLSGFVSVRCQKRGQLGVPIENIVPNVRHAAQQSLVKQLRLRVGRWLAGRNLRRVPLVIAETEFLKSEIMSYWRVKAEQIAVVELGVDHQLFRPLDVDMARRQLTSAPDKTLLCYVGVLDRTHNLGPVIAAVVAADSAAAQLHIVGDGPMADEYRALAKGSDRVVFHGRVRHGDVPVYIAAADLCLAPYDASAFTSGELGYSTMKIPEYLASGRAVASVPTGRIKALIADGDTGFLFDNNVARWAAFLQQLPSRERLQNMGSAAARVALPSWSDTAQGYLAACRKVLQRSRGVEE
jgi:glycosyltransferase involved in cell wall biosynthesis